MTRGNEGLRNVHKVALSHRALSKVSREQREAFGLNVVFTTVPETLAALRRGATLAHQLGATIRVLFPSVVPYPLAVDKPQVDPLFRLRHFRTLCNDQAVETWIDIRLCRDAWKCIHEALSPHSLVLMGDSRRWWRFSYTSRLVRSLRKSGHEVILVEHAERV